MRYEFERQYAKLKQLGMIKKETTDTTYYQVEPTEFNRIMQTFYDYVDEFYDQNPIKESLQEFQSQMLDLKISEESMTDYLRERNLSDSIKRYQCLKNELKYKLIEHLEEPWNTREQIERQISENEYYANKYSTKTSKTKVLNKRNPFADVEIKNNQFLYKDGDGTFQTLAFTTGHTLSKVKTNDTAILTLQPGFSIVKTNERLTDKSPVKFDDTITTKLPETSGDYEIIYI